jgi:hypothetical protein
VEWGKNKDPSGYFVHGTQLLRGFEEAHFDWPLGDGYEMSKPGVYKIALKGAIEPLHTVVCSNTLSVSVR